MGLDRLVLAYIFWTIPGETPRLAVINNEETRFSHA